MVRIRTFWTGSFCNFFRCCNRKRAQRAENEHRLQASQQARDGSGSNQGSLASETSFVNIKVKKTFIFLA